MTAGEPKYVVDAIRMIKENQFFCEKRSTGREDFTVSWVESVVSRLMQHGGDRDDVLRSLVSAVAFINADGIASLLSNEQPELVLAGGSVKNKCLVSEISNICISRGWKRCINVRVLRVTTIMLIDR